jgi:hypothetical protein
MMTVDPMADAIELPATASVGQTIAVQEVDENGKPVKWQAVDFPAGGGGGEGGNNAFCFSLILDKDEESVPIEFPVNWDKIIQYNIHIEMNLTADMAWTTQVGGSWSTRDAFSAGTKGHNIYGIRYMHYGDIGWLFMEGSSTATNSSGTARPTIGQKEVSAMSHSNTYVFYSMTEGVMFPAGTRFDVWGVYAP